MAILRKVRNDELENYHVLDCVCVRDYSLSWEARGLHTFVMQTPPNWEFTIAGLVACGPQGRDKVYRIIRELKDKGYCTKEQRHKGKGHFDKVEYIFHYKPVQPLTDLPYTAQPYTVNPTQLNTYSIKYLINKYGIDEKITLLRIQKCLIEQNYTLDEPRARRVIWELAAYWIGNNEEDFTTNWDSISVGIDTSKLNLKARKSLIRNFVITGDWGLVRHFRFNRLRGWIENTVNPKQKVKKNGTRQPTIELTRNGKFDYGGDESF